MNRLRSLGIGFGIAAALMGWASSTLHAQPHVESRHDIAFNRYYTFEQIEEHLHAMAEAYPELVELRSIGQSRQGRELWVAIVTAPNAPHREKPAMWIDGSIHANEIQASEVVLYTLWYLTAHYGETQPITDLLEHSAFYLMPVVSPDSRVAWFEQPSTPHSRRANQIESDSDLDGRVNEDHPDDLDGDGSITQMWKRDPRGQWVRDRFDPRIFRRVPEGELGDWTYLGQEGIDRDGDGRVSEDGWDGYDMNRNWPADWQPNYVQRGAGPFPLSSPETRAIAEFCYEHTNIAAFQSYHNTGGMLLRGPGTSYRRSVYPREDLRIYDEFGRLGEQMLPYYRYLVIYSDLYNVHGGEATWAAESLGVISFTNELWTAAKYFQRDIARPNEEQMWLFRDRLQFGQVFTDYTEVEHPHHGTVLVGGLNKWSMRSTPTFLLEEECHRNFAFTAFHAEQMPLVQFDRVRVDRHDEGLWSLTVELRNERLIPTRTARQRQASIGTHDIVRCEPAAGRVVSAGRLRSWWDTSMEEIRFEPGRVQLDAGVPGRGTAILRFFIEGREGSEVRLSFAAEKALDREMTVRLVPTPENRSE